MNSKVFARSSDVPKLGSEIIWDNDIAYVGNIQIFWTNDWFRGGEPGWLYRPQGRICPTNKGTFALIDETGWDGYREVRHHLYGIYPSWDKAHAALAQIIGE